MVRPFTIVLFVLMTSGVVFGQQETGHYPAGAEGLKAATLPPPGVYLKWYNFFYSADTLRDGNGNKIDANLDLEVFATAPRLIWMTDKEFLGAHYGMDILVPLVQVDVTAFGSRDSDVGLGDIFLEPVVLGWHGDDWDVGAAAGVWMPTGDFNPAHAANPGKDFWGAMLTLGATGYFDEKKTWSMSGLARYEINSEKASVAVRPGDDFHIEWGLGKSLTDALTIGIAGYTHWQVTDDRGSAVTYDASVHDRFAALGPEILYFCKDQNLSLSLRYQREFGAVDRPEGHNTVFSFVKIF